MQIEHGSWLNERPSEVKNKVLQALRGVGQETFVVDRLEVVGMYDRPLALPLHPANRVAENRLLPSIASYALH